MSEYSTYYDGKWTQVYDLDKCIRAIQCRNADNEKRIKYLEEENHKLKEEYNKAIDNFVTKIKKYMETTEQATYIDEINNGNDNYSAMTIYDYVDELANELKVGEQNE